MRNIIIRYGSFLDQYLIVILIVSVSFEFLIFIGLFLFKWWARLLLLLSLIVPLPTYFILGPIITSPISSITNEILYTGYGILLALAYFSDISTKFEKEN